MIMMCNLAIKENKWNVHLKLKCNETFLFIQYHTMLTCLVLNAPEKNEFFIATHIQSARFSLQQKEYGILGHLTLAETVPTC